MPRCSPARARFWRESAADLAEGLAARGSQLRLQQAADVPAALLAVAGIGAHKADKYGAAFLDVFAPSAP